MASPNQELTPMQRQYRALKEKNKDSVLFFRLGDFYEMFNEDATLAARELDLTLTTRDRSKPKEEQTPMCGVPYHSVDGYIAKLVQKGYCEKQRLPGDGRAVQVMLTPEGKKVEAFHRRCHRRIIAEICEDLSEEEREELLRTMTRINSYFQTKL